MAYTNLCNTWCHARVQRSIAFYLLSATQCHVPPTASGTLPFLLLPSPGTQSTPRHPVTSGSRSACPCLGLPPDPGKCGVPQRASRPGWGEPGVLCWETTQGFYKKLQPFVWCWKNPFCLPRQTASGRKEGKIQNNQAGKLLNFFFFF